MTDVTVLGYLSIDSLSHEAGDAVRQPGGAALYGALGAHRAGAMTAIVASTGPDWPKGWTHALSECGIATHGLTPRADPTRRTQIRHGLGLRQSPHYGSADWLAATLAHQPHAAGADGRVLVATPMPVSALAGILDAAGDRPVVADTSEWVAANQTARLLALLGRLSVFAPSCEETRLLCPGLDDDQSALALAAIGPCIIQKRGAQGLVVVQGADLHRLPAHPAQAVDPTGAGDAVTGAIGAGLARGLTPFAAAHAAMAIGAMAVSGMGPSGLGLSVPAQTLPEEIP
ncbi:carbohydrate kinase family protein [Paracoccus nototheniae]|uniref:Carbohydrate kinase family protein n=1 Tax=Paracoccus nototheniae TaxID=2489002 RepID=A0ABW4E2K9_9RHOB|nr:carbohydrate kinase family protein [Paracoccus nototheniae]